MGSQGNSCSLEDCHTNVFALVIWSNERNIKFKWLILNKLFLYMVYHNRLRSKHFERNYYFTGYCLLCRRILQAWNGANFNLMCVTSTNYQILFSKRSIAVWKRMFFACGIATNLVVRQKHLKICKHSCYMSNFHWTGDSKFSSTENLSTELCIFWHGDKPGIVNELLRDKSLQGFSFDTLSTTYRIRSFKPPPKAFL